MADGVSRSFPFHSPAATAAFAGALAPLLSAGDTILLDGPIGAGKTHFARALIQARLAAAGALEDVPSPTFTLVQTYDDSLVEIWHADLYRLTQPGEVEELGLAQAFDDAICLVEWPDRLGDLTPDGALLVSFQASKTPGYRMAEARSTDRRWAALLDAAHEASDAT